MDERTIPDDQMELLCGAFDAAWMGSLAWNRTGMDARPIWRSFLAKNGLTKCYEDWYRRYRKSTEEEPANG